MTRIEQEKKTVRQLLEIYCHGKNHVSKGLCEECSALLDYAYQRLDHCKFGEPTNVSVPWEGNRRGERPEPSLFGLWIARRRKTVGQKKPTCKKCPIHCYKPDMKEKMREAMRYAGPRMMWHHPIAAIRHLIREL